MSEIQFNDGKKIKVDRIKDQFLLDGEASDFKIEKITDSKFKVFGATKIHQVEIIERNGNHLTLSVDNQTVELETIDRMSQILMDLGMDVAQSTAVSEVKAPMPGSILSIITEEGAEVQNGDQLFILEAMKMENVIKSPGEGIIDKIHVSLNQSVEKNQVLISFK